MHTGAGGHPTKSAGIGAGAHGTISSGHAGATGHASKAGPFSGHSAMVNMHNGGRGHISSPLVVGGAHVTIPSGHVTAGGQS